MPTLHPTAVILPPVTLGENTRVDAYAILGELPTGNQHPAPLKIGNNSHIRSHTILYAGVSAGSHFTTGHRVMVREYTTIGDDVSIGTGCTIEHHVIIGNRVRLHSNVFVPEFSTLQDDCWLGPGVVLTNAKYPCSPAAKKNLVGPTIERFAKIGANVTLLPGVVIGENALIGAGTVVTQDVPAFSVVVGNPGKVIKDVRDLPYEL